MAKKNPPTEKEAATPAVTKKGPGKGKKACPRCGTINGAATRKCTNNECECVFPGTTAAKEKITTTEATTTTGRSGAPSWADDINTKVQAAVEYIKQVGTVEEGQRVLKLVEGLQQKPEKAAGSPNNG